MVAGPPSPTDSDIECNPNDSSAAPVTLPPRTLHTYAFIEGVACVFGDCTPVAEDDAAAEVASVNAANAAAAARGSKAAQRALFTDVPAGAQVVFAPPRWSDFCEAMSFVVSVATNGPCRSWSHSRLTILETQKSMHTLMNHELELTQSKSVPHRDFYNVRKVDNHVHHSACMNQKHLLRYIKKKMREPEADSIKVIVRDGQTLTLSQVFRSLNLTAYDLSIDTLDMHAGQTFQRFDKFNLKYNPIGESRLREIFLKYNNMNKGKYLAEVTKEVFDDLEANKYQFAEYRLSIYGRDLNEWDVLADWVIDNNLFSHNVRWMIQIPRLYSGTFHEHKKTTYPK